MKIKRIAFVVTLLAVLGCQNPPEIIPDPEPKFFSSNTRYEWGRFDERMDFDKAFRQLTDGDYSDEAMINFSEKKDKLNEILIDQRIELDKAESYLKRYPKLDQCFDRNFEKYQEVRKLYERDLEKFLKQLTDVQPFIDEYEVEKR